MKTTIAIVMSLGLMFELGCESPSGGGMSKDESFSIVVPMMAVKIKQGETQIVTVSLDREKYFKQDVKMDIAPSKGIDVEPTDAKIKAEEKPELPLRISAPKDAAIGEYKIYLKATPEKGQSTSMDFTVKVEAP